jgi:hypothetical protein
MRLSSADKRGADVLAVIKVSLSDNDEAIYYFSDGAQLHSTSDDIVLFGPAGDMITSVSGMQDIPDSPYKDAADAYDEIGEPESVSMTRKEHRGLLKNLIQ